MTISNNNPKVETVDERIDRIRRELLVVYPYGMNEVECLRYNLYNSRPSASNKAEVASETELHRLSLNNMLLANPNVNQEAVRAERIALLACRALCAVMASHMVSATDQVLESVYLSEAETYLQAARLEKQTDYSNMSIVDVYARLS